MKSSSEFQDTLDRISRLLDELPEEYAQEYRERKKTFSTDYYYAVTAPRQNAATQNEARVSFCAIEALENEIKERIKTFEEDK